MSSECFSTLEIDAIGEILNISLGSSATAVSTLLNTRVDITTPVVTVVDKEEFQMDRVEPAVGVEITYVEGLDGSNVMLLKRHDVKSIVEMLMGMEMSDEEFELNEINISAVCEVMNQMMGASATALSEFFGKMVNISTPVSFELKNEQEFVEKYFTDDSPWVVVSFILKIADNELEFMTGEADFDKGAAILREQHPNIRLLNVTAGPEGSYSYYDDLRLFVPAINLPGTIETTGAGDTFCACVLNYVLEYGLDDLTIKDLSQMLQFANTAAYLVTTKKGAICSMPEREQIQSLLQAEYI